MNTLIITAICAQGIGAVTYGPVLDEAARRQEAHASCGETNDAEEIVVCAQIDHPTNQRVNQPIETVEIEGPPRAEVKIGDANLSLNAESGNVGGFPSNRIMLGIKIPFGKKAK